jgi:hypothetical protein
MFADSFETGLEFPYAWDGKLGYGILAVAAEGKIGGLQLFAAVCCSQPHRSEDVDECAAFKYRVGELDVAIGEDADRRHGAYSIEKMKW